MSGSEPTPAMMKRDEILKAFARYRRDKIVVAVYTAAQEITHISPNDLNYTFVGAMGQGSSHALGLPCLCENGCYATNDSCRSLARGNYVCRAS